MIFEHLNSTQPSTAKTAVACIYCDSQQQHVQTTRNLVASLWPFISLARKFEIPPPYLRNSYHNHTRTNTKPGLDETLLHLKQALKEVEQAYLIVDALDEVSDPREQENFMVQIQKLLDISEVQVQVLVTSRQQNRYTHGSSMSIEPTSLEIMNMVSKRLQTPNSFRPNIRNEIANRPELRHKILSKVTSNPDGTFLIADLHMKALSTTRTVRAMLEMLDTLPRSLNDYYERSWKKIEDQQEQDKELAMKALLWVMFAKRQLNALELQHALSVREEDKAFDPDSVTPIEDVAEMCYGLIVVESPSSKVRLMHSTVRSFLETAYQDRFGYSQGLIAK